MTPTEFLTMLWGEKPPGQVLIWTLPDKRSTWFGELRDVDCFVAEQEELGKDIYTGVSLAPAKASLGSAHRISNNISAGIAGLWADIDIAGVGHKKTKLPPNVYEAIETLKLVGYEPSIIVHSGHGLQCWWLCQEPWMFKDSGERTAAQQTALTWHEVVVKPFLARGWTMDTTSDLARVMRLPGTTNYKDAPVPVRTIITSDFRWPGIPNLPETSPTASREPQSELWMGSVGELHLSEDLEPNEYILELMLGNPKFKRSWNNKRTDFKDGDESASVYDLSIASYGVGALLSDQQIVSFMVAHRRRTGQDLKLRDDYYRRTIAKARSGR